ncbi:MAG: 30S ribosome-binding factor RbfA [Acidobacteriota bacterium]
MRRPERLAETLREEISEIVSFELDDPRVELVTVTEVAVSPDLRDAKVYVLLDGTDDEAQKALKALRHASGFVRQQVAVKLSIKYTPHLHFVRDTAEENAARVGEVLQALAGKGKFEERTEIIDE